NIPPRSCNREPLNQPSFFAVEMRSAITFAHRGLKIDGCARVPGKAGAPIAGLLAAGVNGAGVHNGGDAGGLAVGTGFRPTRRRASSWRRSLLTGGSWSEAISCRPARKGSWALTGAIAAGGPGVDDVEVALHAVSGEGGVAAYNGFGDLD